MRPLNVPDMPKLKQGMRLLASAQRISHHGEPDS
jgi:hypothetical protein